MYYIFFGNTSQAEFKKAERPYYNVVFRCRPFVVLRTSFLTPFGKNWHCAVEIFTPTALGHYLGLIGRCTPQKAIFKDACKKSECFVFIILILKYSDFYKAVWNIVKRAINILIQSQYLL